MAKRSIVSDEELEKGARAIADDMRVGDTGRLKLARIIDDHLDWFDLARARGLEWTDIIDLLSRAGVTRPDGRPLSRGHLSSLVWRKQKSRKTVHVPMATSNPTASEPESRPEDRPAPVTATPMTNEKPVFAMPSDPAPPPGPARKAGTKPDGAEGKPGERDKVLAYMRRAARARSGE